MTGVNFYGIDIGWDNDYKVKYDLPGYDIYPFGTDNEDCIQLTLCDGQAVSLQDFMTDGFADVQFGVGEYERLDTVNSNCP